MNSTEEDANTCTSLSLVPVIAEFSYFLSSVFLLSKKNREDIYTFSWLFLKPYTFLTSD